MKLHTPLYHALMLAHLSVGQDSESECSAGPVLYAGGWQEHLGPNKDLKCQEASVYFFDQDKRQNIPIQHGDTLCRDYPSINISLPVDAPLGPGRITWLCDSGEKDYCQVITVVAMKTSATATGPVSEYAMTQNCPSSAIYTSKDYNDESNGMLAPTTAPWQTPPAIATATTPGNLLGTAPTRPVADSAATHSTFTLAESVTQPSAAQPPTTQLPETDSGKPNHTVNDSHTVPENGAFTDTVYGNTGSTAIGTPQESRVADPRATPTSGDTDAAGSGPSGITPTQGPTSAYDNAPMPSNDHPCTCAQ
jgi:hypothetical protein